MNLKSFFSLIVGVLFQKKGSLIKPSHGSEPESSEDAYNSCCFYCPSVFAKDGMYISLQINHGRCCKSDKGYQKFSLNWEEVEFGFPEGLNSQSEALIAPFGEWNDSEDTVLTSEVGRIPIDVLEQVFALHGGIDWVKTCACECSGLINS